MPMLVKNPSFEKKLETAARRLPLRGKKTSLMVAITSAALDVASAEGTGIDSLLKELRDRAGTESARVA